MGQLHSWREKKKKKKKHENMRGFDVFVIVFVAWCGGEKKKLKWQG